MNSSWSPSAGRGAWGTLALVSLRSPLFPVTFHRKFFRSRSDSLEFLSSASLVRLASSSRCFLVRSLTIEICLIGSCSLLSLGALQSIASLTRCSTIPTSRGRVRSSWNFPTLVTNLMSLRCSSTPMFQRTSVR